MSTVSATSNTNKRRRSTDASASNPQAAPSSQPPAASTDPADALGPRLEPLKAMLASQPDELKVLIIARSRAMLDLRDSIKRKEARLPVFDETPTDRATGAVLRDAAGNALPFIPHSLRSKCPIFSSTPLSNEPAMRAKLEEANRLHEAHLQKLAGLAKDVAELEVSLRKTQLRHNMFELLKSIALAQIITEEVRADGLPDGVVLTREERADKIAFDVLAHATIAVSTSLALPNATQLTADFSEHILFDDETCTAGMSTQDTAFNEPIVTKITTWLPLLTTTLWDHVDAREREKKVNAALKLAFRPAATAAATDMVDLTITDGTDRTPAESLISMIRHEVKKDHDRSVRDLKKLLRKNSSGGAKTSAPKPTKSGKGSNGPSAAPTATPQPPQQPSQQQKKKKKKTRGRKNSPVPDTGSTTPKEPRNAPGNRGGSSNGGSNNDRSGR